MKAIIVCCCLLLSLGLVLGADQESASNAAQEPVKTETAAPTAAANTAEPKVFKVIDNETNVTCILAQFDGKLSWKEGNETQTLEITNPVVNDKESNCSNDKQILAIKADKLYSLEFAFIRNGSTIDLSSIIFSRSEAESYKGETSFHFPANKTYKCDAGMKFDLTSSSNDMKVTLALSKVKLNAFREADDKDAFEPEQVCSDDEPKSKTNKTVPMIIALILTAMIVTILVVYVILRRRQRNANYQSP